MNNIFALFKGSKPSNKSLDRLCEGIHETSITEACFDDEKTLHIRFECDKGFVKFQCKTNLQRLSQKNIQRQDMLRNLLLSLLTQEETQKFTPDMLIGKKVKVEVQDSNNYRQIIAMEVIKQTPIVIPVKTSPVKQAIVTPLTHRLHGELIEKYCTRLNSFEQLLYDAISLRADKYSKIYFAQNFRAMKFAIQDDLALSISEAIIAEYNGRTYMTEEDIRFDINSLLSRVYNRTQSIPGEDLRKMKAMFNGNIKELASQLNLFIWNIEERDFQI